MRTNSAFSLFLIGCSMTMWSCGQAGLPSSPSALTPATAPGSGSPRLQTRDDPAIPPPGIPAAPAPCVAPPAAGAPAAPTPATAPARLVARDDPAAPVAPTAPTAPSAPTAPCGSALSVIVNIVNFIGAQAFMPNPIMANVGDNIVFTNTDTRLHHIVLDGGTDLGDVAPGASTAPMALTTPTASFHCTIHPTMIGTINMALPAVPYDPPMDDYYGYY